jgi:hypothetical protein
MPEKMKGKLCLNSSTQTCEYLVSPVYAVDWYCLIHRKYLEHKRYEEKNKIYRCPECLKKEKSQ